MTWYADQVLVTPGPGVLDLLASVPELDGHVYHLVGIDGLPKDGLVVAREVCSPDPEGSAEWHGTNAVDWGFEVPISDATPSLPRPEDAPPLSLLALLHRLSREAGGTAAYFTCAFWGGYREYGWSWVFGQEQAAAYELVRFGEPERIRRHAASGIRSEIDGDLLAVTLGRLGVAMKGRHFAPHERAFDWEPFRVGRQT